MQPLRLQQLFAAEGQQLPGQRGGALAGLASLDLTTDPTTASSTIDTLAKALNNSLSSLGAQGRALDIQKTFLTSLSDNIEKGIGSLVDADLTKESARLQSLQVKQQLGAQALSIANQGPQILLSFFR
jgi:flagellin